MIGQAVRNLLDNAFRVAPSGSEVRVTIVPDTLTVADSGAGVPDFVLLSALMYVTADAEALSDFRFSLGDFSTGEGEDGPLAETVGGG